MSLNQAPVSAKLIGRPGRWSGLNLSYLRTPWSNVDNYGSGFGKGFDNEADEAMKKGDAADLDA